MSVVIETTIGDMTVDLLVAERPKACLNFVKLCKIKYYNLCAFHSIQKDFIAQTGDPTGSGRGGDAVFRLLYGEQGRVFDAELKPKIGHSESGVVSMVNDGHGMHGSQFFITLADNLHYLDGVHTVFGHVVEGLDTLVKLNETITDAEHKPYQDIVITHTVVLDDPFDDPIGLDVPPMSPEVSEELLRSNRIGVSDTIDDTDGKTEQEIEEDIKAKEQRERALVLEMIGDIPDAEVKPPENVLFVCKLNPVTREEDLEVIFSRFGAIVSCEVIRDSKSGESLQYAFIEFEREEDCEKAYFKMDNVLIDDRRIHVDFSQSVSKLKWEARAKAENFGKETKVETKKLSDKEKRNDQRSRRRSRSHSPDQRKRLDSRRHRSKSNERRRSRSPDDRRDYRKHSRRHRSRSGSRDRSGSNRSKEREHRYHRSKDYHKFHKR